MAQEHITGMQLMGELQTKLGALGCTLDIQRFVDHADRAYAAISDEQLNIELGVDRSNPVADIASEINSCVLVTAIIPLADSPERALLEETLLPDALQEAQHKFFEAISTIPAHHVQKIRKRIFALTAADLELES